MKVEILNKENRKLYKAAITKMREADFDKIAISNQFDVFKWDGLRSNKGEIFKLSKGDVIIGIVQFFHEKIVNNIIELSKLELSKENVGANKKYDFIAGCLIAFICLHSLKTHSGEVFVFYKKETKNIYLNRYGMLAYDEFYVKSEKVNSVNLVKKYLGIDF